jgi:ankyrin repeat protein
MLRSKDLHIDVNYHRKSVHSGGNTPLALVIAPERGHLSVVKLLLEQGADVDNKLEWSLLVAARPGDVGIVKLLIAAGAKSKCKHGAGTKNPLPASANEQPFTKAHLEVIRLLMRNHYAIGSEEANGHMASMTAIYWNNLELFKVLG